MPLELQRDPTKIKILEAGETAKLTYSSQIDAHFEKQLIVVSETPVVPGKVLLKWTRLSSYVVGGHHTCTPSS